MANASHSSVQPVISALFSSLDEKQIPYAVLRNYETLPENPGPGNDIDILVSAKAREAYLDALAKAVNSAGWAILHKIQRYRYSCYFIYEKETSWPIFQIDSFFSYIWKGFVWIDVELLIRHRIRDDRGFYILPPGGEAAILFLKELLANLRVKEKYRLRIQKLAEQDPVTFICALSSSFGDEVAHEMLNLCIQGEWDRAFSNRRLWKQILVLRALQRDLLRQSFQCAGFLWGHLWDRLRFRKGVFLALVGPDGVGKTTICQDLQNVMRGLFRNKIHYYHGRFGFLPELKSYYCWLPFLRLGVDKASQKETDKVGQLRILLHLLYYGLEYFIAWPWILWARKHGHMLLFDRYFYNFGSQPIYRQLPRPLISTLLKILPRPDVTVVLKGRPNQIQQRKAELSLDEIKAQLDSLQEEWFSKLTQVLIVDTEQPLNQVLNEVRRTLVKFLRR